MVEKKEYEVSEIQPSYPIEFKVGDEVEFMEEAPSEEVSEEEAPSEEVSEEEAPSEEVSEEEAPSEEVSEE
ncbi:MAG: hypothetical protein H3Z52_02535, partial [archaeon]|nr:hypothetical protein [archaeon]